jgi:hypothetical protein
LEPAHVGCHPGLEWTLSTLIFAKEARSIQFFQLQRGFRLSTEVAEAKMVAEQPAMTPRIAPRFARFYPDKGKEVRLNGN